MATSVGRLSSVELMPVSGTLSAGPFGVAEAAACEPPADGALVAAGAAGPHAAEAIPIAKRSAAARRIFISLSAERRTWPPAEEAAFDALGDLHQRDRED